MKFGNKLKAPPEFLAAVVQLQLAGPSKAILKAKVLIYSRYNKRQISQFIAWLTKMMLFCPICSAEIDSYRSSKSCWNCSTEFGVFVPLDKPPGPVIYQTGANNSNAKVKEAETSVNASITVRLLVAAFLFLLGSLLIVVAKVTNVGGILILAVFFLTMAAVIISAKKRKTLSTAYILTAVLTCGVGLLAFLALTILSAMTYSK